MSLVSTVDHTKWSRQIYEECIDLIRKPIEVGKMILRQIYVEQGSNVPFNTLTNYGHTLINKQISKKKSKKARTFL